MIRTLTFALCAALGPLLAVAATPEENEFFEKQVRPLLVQHCLKCHGEEKQESGLRLDSHAALLEGGDAGEPAAVAGEPDQSLLMQVLRYGGDIEMPPAGKLSDEQLATIEHWIKIGLPWPGDAPVKEMTREERLEAARREHWAFQPIRRPSLPAVNNGGWAETSIDRFILARLDAAGLAPSAAASRETFIRRATFDLLGVPPSGAEVSAFVADATPDAYERLIDRLLASPLYGQRWGRHWLDVARYSDTRGYAFARERKFPYAYTYRDYVIHATNDDTPFDRFIVEQLAADQLNLPPDSPRLAALGFLTVGRDFNNRHLDIDDQIDATTRGMMGLTVACARCHDHKYDAIPTEDYYSLYGVFASCRAPEVGPLIGDPHMTPGYEAFQAELDKRVAAKQAFEREALDKLLDTSRRRVTDYLARVVSSMPEELLQKLPDISLSREELKPRLVERWRRHLERVRRSDPVWGPWRELASIPDDQFTAQAPAVIEKWKNQPSGVEQDQINPLVIEALAAGSLQSKIDLARIYGGTLQTAYVAYHDAGHSPQALDGLAPAQRQLANLLLEERSPTNIRVDELDGYLNREEKNRQNELEKQITSQQADGAGSPPRAMVVVENDRPHDPRVFIRGNEGRQGDVVPRQFVAVLAPDRKPFKQGGGRLELAQAIASPENPLTARVIANRLWMHHFGQPLVSTPSDFGIRADPPTHPELLDYMASDLIRHGWSLKQLHREIMLSAVYRQTSVGVEQGLALDPENRLLWRMNRKRLEFEPMRDALLAAGGHLNTALDGKPVDMLATSPAGRRSVYSFIDRQDLPGLLRAFDYASPDQTSESRPRTIVPQQALFFLNSPFVNEQARALASRPDIAEVSDPTERIRALYRLLFCREPSEQEIAIGRSFVEQAEGQKTRLKPWSQYAQLLLETNEFLYID